MEVLNIFIGFDPRQAISFNVLQSSIAKRSSKPVAIHPLVIEQLPITRQGLTPFTYTRFLVPYICDFKGWSLFLDADILLLDDIAKLFEYKDDSKDVIVCKNAKRFEWASVMLFNNERCKILTPDFVERSSDLHRIGWAKDEDIGEFPSNWNHLVGYDLPNNDASLIHYTQGVPAFPETQDCEHAEAWRREHQAMNSTIPWVDLMGRSVHSAVVDGKLVPKYKVEPPHAAQL